MTAVYDDRIVSRIVGGCGGEVITVTGQDRRLERKVPGAK